MIQEKGNFVDVVFYRSDAEGEDRAEAAPDSVGYRRIVPDTLTPQENKIVSQIEQKGSLTTPEVEQVLAVKARRAREVLKAMVEKGLLKKQGNARSTYYVRA